MSKLHFRDVAFDQMLERASVALVVRLAEPAHRSEHVGFAVKTWNGKRCPDFVRTFTRLEVLECIAADHGTAAGAVIEVESANADAELRMHADYYQKGLSRSPIFERFSGAPLDAKTPVIALLCEKEDHYAWVVDVSAVALAMRSQVVKRLASNEKTGPDRIR